MPKRSSNRGVVTAPIRTLNLATRIHGRVLIRETADPVAVVAGFHGYMENADIQMARLEALPDTGRATLVSVQGLNRFYRGRGQEVVAGWMTRQDRNAMIADNIEYIDRALDASAPADVPLFTLGFSQGVAMAFRAALRGRRRADGVIAVGGDVPPELLEDATLAFPAVLLARGEHDDWYTSEKIEADTVALRARHTRLETLVYPGAHDWTAEVSAAAARFIKRFGGR
jgi:predicted esterase